MQSTAALRSKVGKTRYLIGRNLSEPGRQWPLDAHQACIVKSSEKIANAGSLVIGRPQVILVVSHRALSASQSFIGKIGKWSQVEDLVDEFDDRAMLGRLVGNCVHHTVRRNHDRGNAGTLVQCISNGIPRTNLRLSVVVQAIRFIVSDDDGALRPILAAGDRVDRISQ